MKVLCIAAHPDDIELGMGGALHRFRDDWDTTWLVLSQRSASSSGVPQIQRDLRELEDAAKVLQVSDLLVRDIPSQNFPAYRQQIIEELLPLKGEFDLVFALSPHDRHQDHPVVAQEAARVFRDRLVHYPSPASSTSGFRASVFIRLQEVDVEAKVRACAAYKSQHDSDLSRGYYLTEEYIRAYLLRYQDMSEGYLEGFEVSAYII
jgi:LmbE family N-acetylglucosaminyl deacetylase